MFAAAPAGETGGKAALLLRPERLARARPRGCGTAAHPCPTPAVPPLDAVAASRSEEVRARGELRRGNSVGGVVAVGGRGQKLARARLRGRTGSRCGTGRPRGWAGRPGGGDDLMVPLGGLVISDVACRRAGPLSKSVAFLWRRSAEGANPQRACPLCRGFCSKMAEMGRCLVRGCANLSLLMLWDSVSV